jgi:hypothetical protein
MPELNFDATTVDPAGSFEPIPKGDYPAIMIESEFKPTKAGDGEYLQMVWEIVDGEHKGRRLFDRLNLHNKNDTAVKIAQGSLSAICHAVGVLHPKMSEELHGKICLVKVAIEERKDQPGTMKNEVKGYSAVGNKPTAAPADKTSAKPPWKRS